MELDRHAIERRDFSAARRGYDPDEVDRHLAQIADSVAELKQRAERPPDTTLAGAAAEQVRTIVEAAERSAAEIQQNAEREAQRITSDAARAARETRERADADAASHVQRVEEGAAEMLQRAESVDREINSQMDNLRAATGDLIRSIGDAGGDLVNTLRGGAGSLRSDLEAMRSRLADVGDTGIAAPGREEPAPEPAAVAEDAPAVEPELDTDLEPHDAVLAGDGGSPITTVPEEAPLADPGLAEAEPAEVEPAEVEAEPLEAEVAPEEPAVEEPAREAAPTSGGRLTGEAEGARLIALNMALNGTPRDETARYLSDNFDLADQDEILDEVYTRVGE